MMKTDPPPEQDPGQYQDPLKNPEAGAHGRYPGAGVKPGRH